MLNISKNNQAVYILYSERTFASGKTITAKVYNDSDVEISGSPFTLLEIDNKGIYGTSFTPTTIGQYKIVVLEGTTKMSAASIKISTYDIESVGGDTTSILSMLSDMEGTSFLSNNDSLHAIKDYLVGTIQASISQIQNNTLTAVALSTQLLIPTTSTVSYPFYVNVYDEQGLMADPYDQDSSTGHSYISISVTNQLGVDRTANLSNLDTSSYGGKKWLTRLSTGRYTGSYDVATTHSKELLNFSFAYKHAVSEADRVVDRSTYVTAELDDSTKIDAIEATVNNVTYGLSAVKTLIDNYQTINQVDLTNIENKVDIESGLISSLTSTVNTINTNVNTANTNINTANANINTLNNKSDIESGMISLVDSKVDIIDGNIDDIETMLNSPVYGLANIKSLIDAMTTHLTDIKGTGFVSANDSLHAIKEKINTVSTTTGGYIL